MYSWQEGIEKGVPVDLHHAFRSVSVDVISKFAFNNSYDSWTRTTWVHTLPRDPQRWAGALSLPAVSQPVSRGARHASMASIVSIWAIGHGNEHAAKVCEAGRSREEAHGDGDVYRGKASNLQHVIGWRRQTRRISDSVDDVPQAWNVLCPRDTTGNAMTVAAFNVMRTAQIYETLAQELMKAFPDSNVELSFIELEWLPYLASPRLFSLPSRRL